MPNVTLWHNPRCSKSRQTRDLLLEEGISFEEVRYLDQPPTVEELRAVLGKLRIPLGQWIRRKEALYKELGLAQIEDEEALLKAMAEHPRLIERPVVITDTHAALGRPPENVLSILSRGH